MRRVEGSVIRYGRSGFSIVELLVAMAIITILAGVLLPVTIQARNRSRSAACVSNLRQLIGSLMLYSQDWSDRLPHLSGSAFSGSWQTASKPDGTSATHLKAIIDGRVKNDRVFKCPNDFGAPEYGFDLEDGTVFGKTGSSYVPWTTARAGRFGAALNGAVIGSSRTGGNLPILHDYGSDWHGIRMRDGLQTVSAGRINAAFADGHTASVPAYSITTGTGIYTGVVSSTSPIFGVIELIGTAGYGTIEVSGTYSVSGSSGNNPGELTISVSGEIRSADGVYDIDRSFTFSGAAGIESAVRQIVSALESQYGS